MDKHLENQESETSGQHACKILITCDAPSINGEMAVKMTYEGDPALASYLLERAQGYIEHDEESNFC